MSSTTNSSLFPLQSFAVNPKALPPFLNYQRAPTSLDIYDPGTRWQDSSVSPPLIYETTGAGVWSSSGGVDTVLGTANQITVVTAGQTATVSLPSAITAPGSLTTTTSLTAGNGFTVSAGTVSVSSASTIHLSSTDNAAGAIALSANGGTSETITVTTSQGTGDASIGLTSTAGGVTLSGGKAAATAINLTASDAAGGVTVSAGTGNINLTANDVVQSKSSAGANVVYQATNSDNTSGTSNAGVEIATGGASSGDPYLSFQISGVGASTMTMGLDNSSSDTFVISNSSSIGTSNALTLTQAGALEATTSITAGTSLTATLGNVTATNGNFVASTAGTGVNLPVTVGSGAAAGTVTCNGRVGSITFTTFSLAGNADITLTMANSAITGASTRLLASLSGTTTNSALSVKSYTPSAGQVVWVITNGGAATSTADLTIDFVVLN